MKEGKITKDKDKKSCVLRNKSTLVCHTGIESQKLEIEE